MPECSTRLQRGLHGLHAADAVVVKRFVLVNSQTRKRRSLSSLRGLYGPDAKGVIRTRSTRACSVRNLVTIQPQRSTLPTNLKIVEKACPAENEERRIRSKDTVKTWSERGLAFDEATSNRVEMRQRKGNLSFVEV